jgi:hypothetical protein
MSAYQASLATTTASDSAELRNRYRNVFYTKKPSDAERATADDLKYKILALVDTHPARNNPSAVFTAIAELALALTVARFGKDSRQRWIDAFDLVGTPHEED